MFGQATQPGPQQTAENPKMLYPVLQNRNRRCVSLSNTSLPKNSQDLRDAREAQSVKCPT